MDIKELFEILLDDKPSTKLRERKEELFDFIRELRKSDGFDQHNKEWHTYDVFEHILHVVDNVDPTIELRLAALFHDIAKRKTCEIDDKGIGHFPKHGEKSAIIFDEFAIEHNLSKKQISIIHRLIEYHDDYFYDSKKIDRLKKVFTKEEIELLYNLQKADLLAQNPKKHYMLESYEIGKNKLLSKYERSSENEYHI